MGLTNHAILDIIIIVFYVIVLPLSIFNIVRHGFSRQAGWIFITIVALCRLIGASTGIALSYDPTNASLLAATVITSSIGLSPLLLIWHAILHRVNSGMPTPKFPPRPLLSLSIPIIVALIISIVGGTKLFDNDPDTRRTGLDYTKAAIIIYLIMYLILLGLNAYFLTIRRSVTENANRRLLWAGLLTAPFLFVRILYSLIGDFNRGSSIWSFTSPTNTSVVVEALMQILMEFVVVAVWVAVGLVTPKQQPQRQAQNVERGPDYVLVDRSSPNGSK